MVVRRLAVGIVSSTAMSKQDVETSRLRAWICFDSMFGTESDMRFDHLSCHGSVSRRASWRVSAGIAATAVERGEKERSAL